MEAAEKPPTLDSPIHVRLPDVPSISEEELCQALVRGFVAALHSSRERAGDAMARELKEEARFLSREILVNGVLEGHPEPELPVALLGTFYKSLGCRVSAWQESPAHGVLFVEDCPLRRGLNLVGMDCRALCARMRGGALDPLPVEVASGRMPGGSACVHLLSADGNGG